MYRRLAVCLILVSLLASTSVSGALADTALSFANAAFERTWEWTDGPVSQGIASRTWMWGPGPNTVAIQESYAEAPGGTRTVQYFDKTRMEDNSYRATDPWDVTNGLLAEELMTGKMQFGDNLFRQFAPAQVNVAGDANDPSGPTYASFTNVAGLSAVPSGAVYTETIDRSGQVGNDPSTAQYNVTAADVGAPTHHNVASVFWVFMTGQGPVMQNGQLAGGPLFPNPFYATGYPLTEPYWTAVLVGGVQKQVLAQVFERRVLTYTPSNPAGWQVEAGNVGQHYYTWRYLRLGNPGPAEPPATYPSEGDVLYQTSLTGLAAYTGSYGEQGAPTADGYQLTMPPGTVAERELPGTFGDASYSIDLRRSEGTAASAGCLEIHAQLDPSSNIFLTLVCLIYVGGNAVSLTAIDESAPPLGEVAVHSIANYDLSSPIPAGNWTTVKVISKGSQLWFFVNGQYLGTGNDGLNSAGLIGFTALNASQTEAAGLEFRNVVVRAIDGS